jgi:hypothetical protein
LFLTWGPGFGRRTNPGCMECQDRSGIVGLRTTAQVLIEGHKSASAAASSAALHRSVSASRRSFLGRLRPSHQQPRRGRPQDHRSHQSYRPAPRHACRQCSAYVCFAIRPTTRIVVFGVRQGSSNLQYRRQLLPLIVLTHTSIVVTSARFVHHRGSGPGWLTVDSVYPGRRERCTRRRG